jgi:predicted nucleic acid-binding protein
VAAGLVDDLVRVAVADLAAVVGLVWVAACCIRHRLPLVTLKSKDFQDFAPHEGLASLSERD